MRLIDKVKKILTEQSNSGSGKNKVRFGSGAKGEFASGSASMGGEDKTYVKQGKKPLKGKNVKPGQTTGTQTPKRGATSYKPSSGQLNMFTGKPEPGQEVKVPTTYKKKTTKSIKVNPGQKSLIDDPSSSRKKIVKKFKKQQSISDLKKAKKYAKGEYPKIGGGGLKPDLKKPVKGTKPVKTNVSKLNVDKIFSGAGNVKKGGNVPDKNISTKSKGTTPVKTNTSKLNVDKIFDKPKSSVTKTIGVKQSEVSKKAKEFTTKVNKRRAERIKGATGGKKTGSLRKGNLSFPGDRSGAYQATKSDIEARKGFKSKPGGLKADEKNPFVKTDVRKARAAKLGGDIYDQPKFDQKKFEKGLQQTKKSKTSKILPDPFKTSTTKTGSAIKDFKFQPRDITTSQAEKKAAKSFSQFKKDLSKAGANIDIEKKVQNPKFNIKSKGSGASTGSGPDFSSTSSRTGSMKGGSSNTTGGSSTGGGSNKPPKPPKGSGSSMVPPDDSIDPEVVKGKFKEKGKGKSGGSGNMSNKQFKKFRKDQKKMFKKFMKQSKKASKQTVTPPAKKVGNFARAAGMALGKTRKGRLVRAGVVASLTAAHFLDNKLRGPNIKKEKVKIGKPINPNTNKQYKSFADIPRDNRSLDDEKTDNELMKYGNKSLSKDVVNKTAKGGRYNPTGTNIDLKQHSQSDSYKRILKQIQKKNKNPNLNPYKN